MVRIAYDTFSVQTIAMNGLFPLLSSIVMLAEMFIVMMRIDADTDDRGARRGAVLFVLIARQRADRPHRQRRPRQGKPPLHRRPSRARRDPRGPGLHPRGRVLP